MEISGTLKDKNILLGITGGIAAYKAANLARLFIKEGSNVKVVMTEMAKQFITPLTMATLSKNPILVDFYNPENGDWNSHVDMGLWADAYVIAPATANSMGKMAHGIADNLLITSYLSARCPVFFAPTMDLDMYQHPSTQANIKTLISYGNIMIEPDSGELASGLVGKGRMAEPEQIVNVIRNYFSNKQDFAGKTVLITAGPTYENIDPVRFIGNYSSGKMGFALAEELAMRGAKVNLVSGPVALDTKHPRINFLRVVSAQEMHEKCIQIFPQCDAAIMAAAVADYRVKNASDKKIKKENGQIPVIELEENPDIARSLGSIKQKGQILVGFALETNNEIDNARDKIAKKNLNFIVLNSMNDKGAGFQTDTNKITIIDNKGNLTAFELKNKTEVANDIVDVLKQNLQQ